MPMVMDAIDQMSAAEKLQTMDYLWASLSSSAPVVSPQWHQILGFGFAEDAQSMTDSFGRMK